ncbi:MAG: hypothetical protein QW594_01715, partial [Candidatus Woesearchaeota archaeon]
ICTPALCRQFGNCYAQDTNFDGKIQRYALPDGGYTDEFCIDKRKMACEYYTTNDPEVTRQRCLIAGSQGLPAPYVSGNNFDLDILYTPGSSGPTPVAGSNTRLSMSADELNLGVCTYISSQAFGSKGYCITDLDDDNAYTYTTSSVPVSKEAYYVDHIPPVVVLTGGKVKDLTKIPYLAYDVGPDGLSCTPPSVQSVDPKVHVCTGIGMVSNQPRVYACASPIDPTDSECYNQVAATQCIASGKKYCRDGYLGSCVESAVSCSSISSSAVSYTTLSQLPASSCSCYPSVLPKTGTSPSNPPSSNIPFFDLEYAGGGFYYVYAYAKDGAGNPSPITSALFEIDATGPDIIPDWVRAGGNPTNQQWYIVFEGKLTSTTPPKSNVTLYFNTSEQANCTTTLYNSNNQPVGQVFTVPEKVKDRQFIAKNKVALPDGYYKATIRCEDSFKNKNAETFPVAIAADKRILGVFPHTQYVLNKTKINFTVALGIDQQCSYEIRLPEPSNYLVFSSAQFPFNYSKTHTLTVSGVSTPIYYKAVELDFFSMMGSLGFSPSQKYLFTVTCPFPGLPAQRSGYFVLDQQAPHSVFYQGTDNPLRSYNFSEWKKLHTGLAAACVGEIPDGFGCNKLHYCVAPFPCDPVKYPTTIPTNAHTEYPYAQYKTQNLNAQLPVILAGFNIQAPRYFCYAAKKATVTVPQHSATNKEIPPWEGGTYGGNTETPVCKYLLVDGIAPRLNVLGFEGVTAQKPKIVATPTVNLSFNVTDYAYATPCVSSTCSIDNFFGTLTADDSIKLDTNNNALNAKNSYVFSNFSANITFDFEVGSSQNANWLSYFIFYFRANSSHPTTGQYQAVKLERAQGTANQYRLVLLEKRATAPEQVLLQSQSPFPLDISNPTSPTKRIKAGLFLLANGTSITTSFFTKKEDGTWNRKETLVYLANPATAAQAPKRGVFGYKHPLLSVSAQVKNFNISVVDLTRKNTYQIEFYNVTPYTLLAGPSIYNTSEINFTTPQLGTGINRFGLDLYDQAFWKATLDTLYLVRDTRPPTVEAIKATNFYYWQNQNNPYKYESKTNFDAMPLLKNIMLERPSNVTLVLATRDFAHTNVLSEVVFANLTLSHAGTTTTYNFTYWKKHQTQFQLFNLTLPLENFTVGNYPFTITLVDKVNLTNTTNGTIVIRDHRVPLVNVTFYEDEERTVKAPFLEYRRYYVTIRADDDIKLLPQSFNLTPATQGITNPSLLPKIQVDMADVGVFKKQFNGTFIIPVQYVGHPQYGKEPGAPLLFSFRAVDDGNNNVTALQPLTITLVAKGLPAPLFEPGFKRQESLFFYSDLYPTKLYQMRDDNNNLIDAFLTTSPTLELSGFARQALSVTLYHNLYPMTLPVSNVPVITTSPLTKITAVDQTRKKLFIAPQLLNQSPVVGKYLEIIDSANWMPTTPYGSFSKLYEIESYTTTGDVSSLVLKTPLDSYYTPYPQAYVGKGLRVYAAAYPPYRFATQLSLSPGDNKIFAASVHTENRVIQTPSHYTIYYDAQPFVVQSTYPGANWRIPTSFETIRLIVQDNKPITPIVSAVLSLSINQSLNLSSSLTGTLLHDYPNAKTWRYTLAPTALASLRNAQGQLPSGHYAAIVLFNDTFGKTTRVAWNFTAVHGAWHMPYPTFYNSNDARINATYDLFYPQIGEQTYDFSTDDQVYFINVTNPRSLAVRIYGDQNDLLDLQEITVSLRSLATNQLISLAPGSTQLPSSSFLFQSAVAPQAYMLNITTTFLQEKKFTYLYTLVVDTQPPVLSSLVVSPKVSATTPMLDLRFVLGESYPSSMYFSLVNNSLSSPYNLVFTDKPYALLYPGQNHLDNLPLPPDILSLLYVLQMRTYDQAGNMQFSTALVDVDVSAPFFSLDVLGKEQNQKVVAPGAYTQHYRTNFKQVVLNLTMVDLLNDVNASWVCFTNDQFPQRHCMATFTWFENKTLLSPQVLKDLSGGAITNNLSIFASDTANNTITRTVVIVVDKQPPSIVSVKGNLSYEAPLVVTLTEYANLTNVRIKRTGSSPGQPYPLVVVSSIPSTNFTLGIAQNVPNGTYKLSFTAIDLVGNTREFTDVYQFAFTAKPFTINLTKPTYGWSAQEVFPIEITSSRPLSSNACRYTNNSNLNYEQMEYTMVQGSTPFVFGSAELINITTFGNTLNVACKDPYGGLASKIFTSRYYPYPASITNVSFNPQPIVEYPLESALTVVTNVSSVCRYDILPKPTFSAYTYAMPGITNTHVQLINKTTFPGIDDFTGA